MTDAEAIGDAMTGGVLARAVEPGAGEGHGGAADACLNCGTRLQGDYCHACGQSGHVHRSLGAFGHDIAHGVLHFEGKIWRTLPKLFLKPGELTRRYIHGERARFVSPFALFLFAVFLMFATFSAIGGPFDTSGNGEVFKIEPGTKKARETSIAELAQLNAQRAQAVARRADTAEIDTRIADLREDIGELNVVAGEDVTKDGGELGATKDAKQLQWFETAYKKAKANPKLLLYKLQNNGYKFSWALIPLSVPFVWLLFAWKRQYKMYDHAVFVTYSIAFVTLLAIAASVFRALGAAEGIATALLVFIPPVHMYRQLRGAYVLGRFGALWRTLFLVTFAVIAATLYFLMLLTMGVLG